MKIRKNATHIKECPPIKVMFDNVPCVQFDEIHEVMNGKILIVSYIYDQQTGKLKKQFAQQY